MHLNFITGNILEKFNTSSYNVIYTPQNNLFDHAIMCIDDHRYFIFGDNKTDYGLSNMINLPNSYISLYNYNLGMTSNIIAYSTNNLTKSLHLNSIIFTHSNKPPYIKKEDVLLMQQKLHREQKVFFTDAAKESWKMSQNAHTIRYGIPKIFQNTARTNDRKDVLIINFEKLPYSQQIQEALIRNNISCDMLGSSFCTTAHLNDQFNKYRVVIDLAEHGVFNLLCSIACGCFGVSMRPETLDKTYADVDGLVFINSIEEILSVVEKYKNIMDDQRQANSQQVMELFNFNIFKEKLDSLIRKANTEVFIP